MEDLRILNDILMNATYNNKVLLEIELNKVSDKRLVIGMLTLIFTNLDTFEADKKTIVETLALFTNKAEATNEYITGCLDLFRDSINKYRSKQPKGPSVKTLNKFLDILYLMRDMEKDGEEIDPATVPEFVKIVKECDDSQYDAFKEMIVKAELYEFVAKMEEIRKTV